MTQSGPENSPVDAFVDPMLIAQFEEVTSRAEWVNGARARVDRFSGETGVSAARIALASSQMLDGSPSGTQPGADASLLQQFEEKTNGVGWGQRAEQRFVDLVEVPLSERNRYASQHDGLTGLRNRRWLEEKLEDLDAVGDPVAILLVDLDDLKTLNDQSYETGDQAIIAAAEALKDVVARVTTDLQRAARRDPQAQNARVWAVRLGGDELAVLGANISQFGAVVIEELLEHKLEDIGVKATVGTAVQTEEMSVRDVLAAANQAEQTKKEDKKYLALDETRKQVALEVAARLEEEGIDPRALPNIIRAHKRHSGAPKKKKKS